MVVFDLMVLEDENGIFADMKALAVGPNVRRVRRVISSIRWRGTDAHINIGGQVRRDVG